MPQIHIPALGSAIKLEQDWEFRLYDEPRNVSLQELADLLPPYRIKDDCSGLYEWRRLDIAERQRRVDASVWTHEPYDGCDGSDLWGGQWHAPFVLRAETVLIFDRYYIRRGRQDYDSVTFRSDCWMSRLGDPLFTKKYVNGRKVKNIRFWAKLDDVNKIVGKPVQR